jgi:hypothetical protein
MMHSKKLWLKFSGKLRNIIIELHHSGKYVSLARAPPFRVRDVRDLPSQSRERGSITKVT